MTKKSISVYIDDKEVEIIDQMAKHREMSRNEFIVDLLSHACAEKENLDKLYDFANRFGMDDLHLFRNILNEVNMDLEKHIEIEDMGVDLQDRVLFVSRYLRGRRR